MACLLFGLLMATLPHWIRPQPGQGAGWIASGDELGCYLSVGAQAYHNHPWRLTDPVLADGGDSIYPALQLVPGIWIAKIFGLGPMGVTLGWRIWAGLMLPTGFYLLLRRFVALPWAAAALTALLLADHGLIEKRLVDRHFIAFFRTLASDGTAPLFGSWPQFLHQWRIITPGLSLVFLCAHVGLLVRARRTPSRSAIVLSGLGFGLLIWSYFYYWTAASVALAICWLVDPPARKTYLHTGWIGGLVGLPALVLTAWTKHTAVPGWLQNLDMFVPVPRLSEHTFPPVAIGMTLAFFVWCWWRRRDLLPLAAMAAAGMLCTYHHFLTGIGIQDGHWNYVWGPFSGITAVVVAADLAGPHMSRRPWLVGMALVALAAHLGTGIMFRVWEGTGCREPLALNANWRRFVEQRIVQAPAPLEPNTVVAGDRGFADFALIQENTRALLGAAFLSPSVDASALDERTALNDHLLGLSASESQAKFARDLAAEPGLWAQVPGVRARSLARGLAIYRSVAAHVPGALRRYGVRYVALPAATPTPRYLAEGWKRLQAGPHWQLWERVPSALTK